MKELTREQELKVIRSLCADDVINNGGGRVVFDLGADVAEYLELPNKDYVVKVALGDKGLNQNELEVEQYIKHHDEIALAEIPAVGHIVVLMEKVDTEITDLLYEYYNDDLYGDYDEDDDEDYSDYPDGTACLMKALKYYYGLDKYEAEDSVNEIDNIMEGLNDLYGSTCDNAQIGRNEDGHWVSFDYGFDPELGCGEQCSDTRDYIDTGDWCDLFLNTLMENINDYPELWECSPHGLMKQVEDEFFSYINGDEEEEAPENIPETLSWEYSYTAADINSFCRTSKKYFINAEKSLDNPSYIM